MRITFFNLILEKNISSEDSKYTHVLRTSFKKSNYQSHSNDPSVVKTECEKNFNIKKIVRSQHRRQK